MNKISIGFSKPKKWKPLAWLIQKIEGTEYSHVFVTWHCKNIDRRKVFEAVGSGIRILSNVNFRKNAEVVELYDYYVDNNTIFKIEQKSHDMTGKPYGYKALIGLAYMRALNCFYRIINSSKRIKNPFVDGNASQICVEAGGMVYCEINKIQIDFENYGLLDINRLVNETGTKATQEKINRINGII